MTESIVGLHQIIAMAGTEAELTEVLIASIAAQVIDAAKAHPAYKLEAADREAQTAYEVAFEASIDAYEAAEDAKAIEEAAKVAFDTYSSFQADVSVAVTIAKAAAARATAAANYATAVVAIAKTVAIGVDKDLRQYYTDALFAENGAKVASDKAKASAVEAVEAAEFINLLASLPPLAQKVVRETTRICSNPVMKSRVSYDDEFRSEVVGIIGWPIPCLRTAKQFASIIDKRLTLSIASGAAQFESLMFGLGVPIRATDSEHIDQPYMPVEQLKSVDAVKKYECDVLYISWPAYGDQHTYQALMLFKGSTVIYVGEGPGGCCATDSFFDHLKEHFDRMRIVFPHFDSWSGIYDFPQVYTRKK
jgi:hypothetical protein